MRQEAKTTLTLLMPKCCYAVLAVTVKRTPDSSLFFGPSKREVCAGTYVAATWQSGPAARKHLHSTHSRHFSKSKLMSLMSSVVGLLLAEGKTQITKNKAETAIQSWRKL